MIVILALAALIAAGLLFTGLVLVLTEAVRRLLWLTLRLLAASAIAVVGAVTAAGIALRSPGRNGSVHRPALPWARRCCG